MYPIARLGDYCHQDAGRAEAFKPTLAKVACRI
jgi:hypothetical protein